METSARTTPWWYALAAAGIPLALAAFLLACGGGSGDLAGDELEGADAGAGNGAPRADTGAGGASDAGGAGNQDAFVPEDEEFLVREVASTEEFVFVPNSGESSSTVARIDGRNLSIVPVRVALEPVAVRAADLPDVGAVAYVLSQGTSAVSVIRAEKIDKNTDPERPVNVLPVPREINSLALSPDGRHALAYIDPDKPLPTDASVASLQVASLIRLGDADGGDRAFQLSISRLVRDVEFTEDGSQVFVVGRDGINRIVLDEVDSDALVPTLDLELSDSAFPPSDREIEVGPEGQFLAVRSSQFSGIALHRPPAPGADSGETGETERVSLPEKPTDIDLHVPEGGAARVIVSLPNTSKVALVDVDQVFQSEDTSGEDPAQQSGVEIIDAGSATPGLAQIAPDDRNVLLYTTRQTRPDLGLLDLDSETVQTYPLRNQIRSVAVGPNSETGVVIHEKQEGPPPSDASTLEFFQHNHGLTLFELETGYRRPVTLRGEPGSFVLTTNSDGRPLLYTILRSSDDGGRGMTRVDLSSYRTDFRSLPRRPKQLGRVAGKIFVSQESDVGRITFFDVDSGERQTVSGYELNSQID